MWIMFLRAPGRETGSGEPVDLGEIVSAPEKSWLKPILRRLGIPDENVGLHAFRHGLETELAETEPITVLQAQMRHADVRTTLKVNAHVIPQSQRNSTERIANRSIGTNVPIGTGSIA